MLIRNLVFDQDCEVSVPSGVPSGVPSVVPRGVRSGVPSGVPRGLPIGVPSGVPSRRPSSVPRGVPSGGPSVVPRGVQSGVKFFLLRLVERLPNFDELFGGEIGLGCHILIHHFYFAKVGDFRDVSNWRHGRILSHIKRNRCSFPMFPSKLCLSFVFPCP